MSDTPDDKYYDSTGKTSSKNVSSDGTSSDSSNDGEETAEDIEKKKQEEEQKEDEEKEEEFHPHKGKIMGIKPYTTISSVSWDKSYDNPTGTGKAEFHYPIDEREEFKKYVYKGVSCKLKLRRSSDKQFSATGIEEIDLTEEEIVEREHYPTKEQKEQVGIDESLDDLVNKTDSDKTSEEKEQEEAEETKPYIRSDGDGGVYGFVTDVTHSQKGTELEVKDWGYCLEDNTKKLSFNNMLRSQIIEEVIKSYGLVPAVDFTGLKDDMISWTNVTGSGDGDSDGDYSVSGDGSMTESEAWEIAQTFNYAGIGTNHDPQKAWDMIKDKKGSSADCYDCTAWLYYVFNMKVGIPARDICYHSDYASSGSHHTIQLYKNGSWIDPPEYDNMTTNLKVIKSRNKSQDHVCRSPPSGGSIPPYDKCPHSNNG